MATNSFSPMKSLKRSSSFKASNDSESDFGNLCSSPSRLEGFVSVDEISLKCKTTVKYSSK